MMLNSEPSGSPTPPARDWQRICRDLDAEGHAVLPGLLSAEECRELSGSYRQDALYRSRIVMSRHGFGRGEYKYFAYPLPARLNQLRHSLYPCLVPIANRWNRQLRAQVQYPDQLDAFLARCHQAGQLRPTPLILEYGAGDYNCLHQDLYGDHVFPLQIAIQLSDPGRDFSGGEFVMTERVGSGQRAEVVPLGQGDGVIFAVHQRPVRGVRGMRKAVMRHGVSRVHRGQRHTLGLIFHDAR